MESVGINCDNEYDTKERVDVDDDDDEAPSLVLLIDEATNAIPSMESVSVDASHTDGVFRDNNHKNVTTMNDNIQQQQQPKDNLVRSKVCPVTILSGFLGAGKTTLLQYILRSPDHGKRIAVIENEFANNQNGIQIESMLIRNGNSKANANANTSTNKTTDTNLLQDIIVELPNGCLCCTVKDSLVVTMETLLRQHTNLDCIVIECSGLANPGPIAANFWLEEALQSILQLDGIITIVDALHIRQQIQETHEAAQQIAYADRILLNKIDLISSSASHAWDTSYKNENENTDIEMDNENATNWSNTMVQEEIASLQALIRSINPTAKIQSTSYSMIPDLDWILDIHCYDNHEGILRTDFLTDETEFLLSSSKDIAMTQFPNTDAEITLCQPCTTLSAPSIPFKPQRPMHSHTSDISTITLTLANGSVSLSKMHQWLATILWPNQDEKEHILRALIEQKDRTSIEEQTSVPDTTTKATPTVMEEPQPQQQQQQIFRMKGILSIQHSKSCVDSDNSNSRHPTYETCDPEEEIMYVDARTGLDQRKYIVQVVHDIWDITAADPSSSCEDMMWSLEEHRSCTLIIIGRHLQNDELRTAFRMCRA